MGCGCAIEVDLRIAKSNSWATALPRSPLRAQAGRGSYSVASKPMLERIIVDMLMSR